MNKSALFMVSGRFFPIFAKNTLEKVNCNRHGKVNKRQIFGARSPDPPRRFPVMMRVHARAKVNKVLTNAKGSPLYGLISPGKTGLHSPNNNGLTEFLDAVASNIIMHYTTHI